jgi:hypothetical protein
MKKIFAVIALMIAMTSPAVAQSGCDAIAIQGMPESVIIDLKKKCLELAKPIAPSITVDDMGEYAELGKKYGIALSEVAKSIGTTVNELAQTPVGKFMLIMVAYNVMGEGLIGVFGGAVWFLTMIPLWIYMFHRMVLSTRSVRETYDHTNSKLSNRVINPVDWNGPSSVIAIVMMFVMLFICVSGFVMIFG